MSRVFLASERALRRRVVIKVLSPELARGVSADRFRLEIQVAASLHHPHIVPLLAAGEAAGHLYYTMPFVAGESLRARLVARRRAAGPGRPARPRRTSPARSPTPTATASSTATSSRRTSCSPRARPRSRTSASPRRSRPRPRPGRSPRPATRSGRRSTWRRSRRMADPTADHRADLYALGVLGYEMLAGQPPFTGRTPQQLIAAHATETPVPLEQRRPNVPAGLARLVMRLLHKRASDRPQSADEVLAALESVGTPAEGTATVAVRPEPPRRGRWLAAGGIVAAALVLSLAWLGGRPRPRRRQPAGRRHRAVPGHRRRLRRSRTCAKGWWTSSPPSSAARPACVRPTRAPCSSAWSTEAGEPRELSGARRDAGGGRGRGRTAGAGRDRRHRRRLTVSARILDVPGGETTSARASAEGSADSLPQLVDRLAANLLALGAGEEEQRLAPLTSTSLPALRAYLDGEALLRRGDFREAERKFLDALSAGHDLRTGGPGRGARRRSGMAATRRAHSPPGAIANACPAATPARLETTSGAAPPRAIEHGRPDQGRGAVRGAGARQPGRLVQAGRLVCLTSAGSRG